MSKLNFDWPLMANRSALGRELLAERVFKRNRKSQLIAYACWALLGGMGLHRVYLGQWKQGIVITLIFIIVFVLPIWLRTGSQRISEQHYSTLYGVLLLFGLGIFLMEGCRLYFLVRTWNNELKQEIEMKTTFV